MPVLHISPDDVLRGETVKPDWYRLTIVNVETNPSKKDGSDVYYISLRIKDGPYAGVPLMDYISEKAPGTAIRLVKACGGKVGKEGANVELNDLVGKEVMGHVAPEEYNNRMVNKVDDYRPV